MAAKKRKKKSTRRRRIPRASPAEIQAAAVGDYLRSLRRRGRNPYPLLKLKPGHWKKVRAVRRVRVGKRYRLEVKY